MSERMKVLSVISGWLFLITSGNLRAEEDGLPAGFRFVGNYQFEKRVKLRDGKPIPIATKAFVCRVFTDGITVRVYGGEGAEGYTSFTIYQNDGIMLKTGTNVIESVPGVQAQTLVGNVMRQLTLTQQGFVLTTFPALSDVVELTYANRLVTFSRFDQE